MFFCDALEGDDQDGDDATLDLSPPRDRVDDPAVVAAEAGRTLRPRRVSSRRARRRRAHRARAPPDDVDEGPDAFSVAEFCQRHGISQSFYFVLQAEGRGPRIMRVGRRTLISREAAAAWRRQQEKASRTLKGTLSGA